MEQIHKDSFTGLWMWEYEFSSVKSKIFILYKPFFYKVSDSSFS